MATKEQLEKIANQVHSSLRELANAIENANEHGLIVQLEVFYNYGGEGILLHRLSGELHAEVGIYEKLGDLENQK